MRASSWIPVSDGDAGVRVILGHLNRMKEFYGAQPAIRAAALAVASGGINDDDAGHLAKLARFVRQSVIYVKDPVNAEFVQTPDVLLLQIHETGKAYGDCDDHVLLFAALVESLGIYCNIVGVKAPGSARFDHVICVAEIEGREIQVDLCAKSSAAPHYAELMRP